MIQFIAAHAAAIVAGILILFGLLETFGGFIDSKKRRLDDYLLENISAIVLLVVIKPGIVLAVTFIGDKIFPNGRQLLATTNFWLVLLLFLIVDDFLQYWYHRLSHQHAFFWKLHRPHHTAEEMGLLVSYRNAALYYLLMPNIWWLALVTFWGGGLAVALGLVIKQIVIVSSHSPTKWDKPLYSFKMLSPIAFIVEHILITPAFHYAHHGKSQADEISDPNGNFGNMFSIWDQLFGTAKFTRKYPTDLGLPNDPKDNWASNFLYPMVTSSKEGSEISKGYKREKHTGTLPAVVELEAGSYLFCQCGYSKTQPFCDGSHHGTTFKPLLFTVKQKQKLKLCTCKLTAKAPYCDNSHLKLQQEVKN
jgi:sterol desaturase/sphingolipid hydroxylase (fatty acid hydroxylase superfamily)/CDGSH-type Zn-finger protein